MTVGIASERSRAHPSDCNDTSASDRSAVAARYWRCLGRQLEVGPGSPNTSPPKHRLRSAPWPQI